MVVIEVVMMVIEVVMMVMVALIFVSMIELAVAVKAEEYRVPRWQAARIAELLRFLCPYLAVHRLYETSSHIPLSVW